MDSNKLAVKFFVDGNPSLPTDAFVPIFHHWIQGKSLPDHLLIDVADYAHVPNGPGTLIVTHEANIHMDREEGNLGLQYIRKQPAGSTLGERLKVVFRGALSAAAKMEAEPSLDGKLKFKTDRVMFRINDRLNGPNTPETFAAVKPELEKYLAGLYQGQVTLTHRADPERLFQVDITAASSPSVATLLGRA